MIYFIISCPFSLPQMSAKICFVEACSAFPLQKSSFLIDNVLRVLLEYQLWSMTFREEVSSLVMSKFSGMWNNYTFKKPYHTFWVQDYQMRTGLRASTTGLGPSGTSWRRATRDLTASFLYFLKSQTLKRSQKLNSEGLRNILVSFPCHCCCDPPSHRKWWCKFYSSP